MEAIILAGGLGSRLQSVVSGLPKPMAPVNGKPFLHHVLKRLVENGAATLVLSVCHMCEIVMDHFKDDFMGVPVKYSVEVEPLGTGGAIYKSLSLTTGESVLVLNGDTFFEVDFKRLMDIHRSSGHQITMALKPLEKADRYGVVHVSGGRVTGFEEKTPGSSGLINAGVYAVKRDLKDLFPFPGRFSFEVDLLQKRIGELMVGSLISDGYFIDIGIPEDYERASREIS